MDDPSDLPLRTLCRGLSGPDTVEIYALDDASDDEAPAGWLNRIGGMPVGVTDERWPVDRDRRRYAHVCTLDLATMPALAAEVPGARAAVLFVCDPSRDRGGDDPRFVHRWVMLSEDEAARGVVATPGRPGWVAEHRETARPFDVEAHRVPRAVFVDMYPRTEPKRITDIRGALLMLGGRAGGGAVHVNKGVWWPDDPFFLQIDRAFGGLNVGHAGFAYVERDKMLWFDDESRGSMRG